MSFLGDLADSISSRFSLGENTTNSLDAVIDGQQVKYGSLGSIASRFDRSAERKYTESGYMRLDPYNTSPTQYETLWQEPIATVLVKKRMFSSIAENYRPDFMDADEKLFYKATHILFQNKCNQIAALEKLSKIQQVTAAVGNISDQLVPIIITLADTVNNGFGSGSNLFGAFGSGNAATTQDASSFIKTVDRLRTLYAYNQTAPYTSWLVDSTDLFQSTFGGGSGVIEITNFTSINTTTSVDLRSPGTFNFNISDPYESMLITDYDIEVALSDATNLFYNNKAFQFGVVSANQVIADQQKQLNTIRNARNASPITFKIDPDTLLSKRVIAIIDRLGVEIQFTYDATGGTGFPGLGGFGDSVSVSPDYLRGGAIAGYDGLDTGPGFTGSLDATGFVANTPRGHGNSELDAFKTIITTIFQQLQLLANSKGTFTHNNDLFNYARRKLRFTFSGKLIIQPMDVVHIYMGSKSQFDNKILAGLQQMFTGVGILQNLNNTAVAVTNAVDTLFNPSGNISIEAEKSIYVGPNFPNYLWAAVRNQFVAEKEGAHVFAGVVESAIDNWSDGKFSISVSGKDNTYYFDQGKVNFKPGVDAFNGLIFDPLTPFKSNFDTISTNNVPDQLELLDENKNLLSATGSGSLAKHKLGWLAGHKATEGNYIQDQSINPYTGRLTRVFYAPDGLAYKWKQGIGIFTQFGSTANLNDPNLVGNPNIYAEPFAGLDVMNVLSLLVTGTPYNFATYYRATADLFGVGGDPQSKQNAGHSYIDSLRNDLVKRNTLWGNFIPFKILSMNESMVAEMQKAQITITNVNSDLDNKLRRFNDIQKNITLLGAVNALSTKIGSTQNANAAASLKEQQAQLTNLQQEIGRSLDNLQSHTKDFLSQVDTSSMFNSNFLVDGKNDPSDSASRKLIRRQINHLTRRMSYDVRGNQDKNLFIVDDYYDIDYDIAAFNKSLSDGIRLYSTEFTSVREKIMNVADLLNLEVFADTQGHIRVRPPQYNRMPSSVFYRMMYLKQVLGVQIFPKFLDKLFTDQLSTLRQRIEIIEDKIRLDCAILGHYPSLDVDGDTAAADFLIDANAAGGKGGTFSFLSDSSDTITDINNLIRQANQDAVEGAIDQSTSNYKQIAAAGTATKQLFGNAERYTVLFQALQAQNQAADGSNTSATPPTSVFQQSIVQTIIRRINTKSGQYITSKDYLSSPGPNQPLEIDTSQTIDFFKVTSELTTSIQEWQAAVKLFYHTIKNAAEFQSLDSDTSVSNNLIIPGLFGNKYIPEVYEHMIEDESYDDYGLNSGARYVIKRSQIRNISIAENAPAYTAVEVQGTLPFFQENQGPPGLLSFPAGGNALVTAMAIDYDMWRNYGYKEASVLKVPFLTDPVSQCGPYAAMVLSRNRSNILRGTLTIAGNEFMQPGEVIFLEDRNMLFYVNSVRHSFAEGGSFNTTLELSYGHTIGEYIPTVMDTIGKLIYKNQEVADTIVQRQDSSGQEESLGVIQINSQNPTANIINTGAESDQINSFAASNTKVLNNILYNTKYLLNANDTAGNNIKVTIELRLYYDNKKGDVDTNLTTVAQQVKQQLTGQSQGPQNFFGGNQPVKNATIPKESISIATVNVDDRTDRRSPSQQAIDAARNQIANASTQSSSDVANNDVLRKALFSSIVDCWIVFTQVPDTIASGTPSTPGK